MQESSEEAETRNEFHHLIADARSGSQEAARQLVRAYGPHVLRAVRRKLYKALRGKFDSVDFTQAVWASFFAAFDRLDAFRDPNEMIAFLTRLAHHKVVGEAQRRFGTAKLDVRRERSLDDSALALAEQLVARQPTPSAVVVADEMWSRLLRGCEADDRRVLELRREGHTHEEIAEQLGVSERTVRRIIERVVRERLR